MAHPRLTLANHELFIRRINAIKEDSPRKFGTLTPAAMLRHLRLLLGMSLGEVEAKDMSVPVLRDVLKFMMFRIFTKWPGGLKGPTMLTPSPDGDLEHERAAMLALMARFVEEQSSNPGRLALHPIFGPQTLSEWGLIHGVHFAHHFRQFGV